jgi:gliding motility-associated-like protein
MIFDTICKNQTRSFNNQTLNTTGIYKDTLTNSQGCDSFLYLNLLVKDTTKKDSFRTICKNQSLLFNGNTLNISGIYKDTFVNSKGCDSFVYLHLTVKDTTKKDSFLKICRYNPVTFNGQNLATTGTYKDTLINAAGCDSFIYLHLTVNDTSRKDSFRTICKNQFIIFNGNTLNVSGIYKDTLLNSQGCDSFVYLHLTVNDTSSKIIYDTICKNQPRSFNNQTLNTTGIYKDTLTNSKGCDSFIYLNLQVKDTSSKTIYDTICSNQTRLFNGVNQTTTGIYKDTLTNAQGCDSFLYLNLYVKPISTTIMNASICQQDSYKFNNRTLYIAGTYRDTFVNAVNCDSIVILNLLVNPLPLANAGADMLRVNCKGDSVFIGAPAIAGMIYEWSPNLNLSSTNTAQTWAKPISQVDYILKVANSSTSCFAYDTVRVSIQNVNLSTTITKTNLKCFNDNSGKLLVRASGGYRPYSFWVESQTAPQTDSNIIGLKAGSGFYRVEDAKGCELRDTYSLTEPARIQINLINKKNLKCFQDNKGEIEVQLSGGTPIYNYSWSRSSQNSNKIINLPAGQHTLTVTDGNGCIASFTESLTEPQTILINPILTPNKCFGESKGMINLQVSQATPPYTYKWNIDSTSSKISNLKAGRYSVTIVDKNLCEFKHSDSLIDPEKLRIDSIVSTPNGCGERASGQLTIFANGGTRDYIYSIDSGNRYIRDSVFIRLEAAKYNIVVRDFNGCLAYVRDSVKGYSLLAISIMPSDTTITLGQEVQLRFSVKEGNVQWIKDIQWSPSDGLSCTDCYEPRVSTYTTQTYKIRIKYFRDCYVEETVKIRVTSTDTFYIPTAFSPNAMVSDENKVLRVYGNNIAVARMSIFNRWGEKLFEAENAHLEGWDGRYKDQDMPTGVYIYYCEIEFLDRRKLVKTGEVNLIR